MADIAVRSQRLVNDWLKRQTQEGVNLDPLNVGGAFLEMTTKLLANPTVLMQAQMGLWRDYMTLWQNTTRRMLGEPAGKKFTENNPRVEMLQNMLALQGRTLPANALTYAQIFAQWRRMAIFRANPSAKRALRRRRTDFAHREVLLLAK